MRFEYQRPAGQAGRFCQTAGAANDLLMPNMHPVKISQRDGT
jgi:hypothetical protein